MRHLPASRARGRSPAPAAPATSRTSVRDSPRAIFIGFNALGDTLCTTPTIRAYRRRHPEAHVTCIVQSAAFTRVLDGNPDIDRLVYSELLAQQGRPTLSIEWLYRQPLDFSHAATVYHFDMNQVCSTKEAFESHIARGLSTLVGIPIEQVRPVVFPGPNDAALAASLVRAPYAVLAMHSNANPKRQDGCGCVKDWPRDRWTALCEHLRRRGIAEIIAVGSEFDPQVTSPAWRNLYGLPILAVGALLREAEVVVTLENGLGHLAHGVDAPLVMIYSNVVPLNWANPVEATNREVLYGDPRLLAVDEVGAAVDRVLWRRVQAIPARLARSAR